MRLDERSAAVMQQTGRHNPEFLDVLVKLRADELEATAATSQELFCTHKGRVQMLTELLQQLRPLVTP